MLLQKIKEFNIPVVKVIESFEDIQSLITYTRSLSNAEGFILSFHDGHKLKIKADEYVRIHKMLDRVRFDRNIVDLIINENMDDVVPMMPEHEVTRIRKFEIHFWDAFKVKEDRLLAERDITKQVYDNDRKRIALEFIPTLETKADAGFIFKMLDGHDIRELMLAHIEKNISTNTKWDECAKWLGM